MKLTNNITPYNFNIIPGPPTESDHFPIVMTISTSPIQIAAPHHKRFSRANWFKYKQILETHDQQNEIDTIETIDEKISSLQSIILKADKEAIPTQQYKTIPHPPNTPEVTNKIIELKTVYRNIERNGNNHN